ncbi:PAS domain S-box protein [Salinibacter ruber]|uniref:PAS domain S-box protein n=1 Tax=Salinibacter ruber TaxID=146919 RepID=UPI000E57B2DF|nr:PAS domain S-box protein [Salinibacter ruber]
MPSVATPDSSKLIDQLSLLYELSLSVGATLEPVENAAAFAGTLAARKDLEGVAVWRRNEEGRGLHLLHATPASYAEAEALPPDHALVQRLRADTSVSTHASNPEFKSLATGRAARGGALAALRLGNLGFLELHDSRREAPFPPRELRQLDPVLVKLEQALRGGRSHQQLEEEVEHRVRTEEALRRSRSQLSALVQNLQDAVLLENEDRELLLANQAFCDLFDIPKPPEALRGADCGAVAEAAEDLFADPTALSDRVESILTADEPVSAETLHLNDGRILERDYVPIDLDDETTGHLWKYRDVTEQRRFDARLQERERAYRRLVESASDIIYRCDRDGCFTYVNPVATEVTGYAHDELVGQHFTALVHPDHQGRLVHFYENQIDEEIPDTRQEFPIVTADGGKRWVSQQVQLVRKDGAVVGVQAIARDITERRQAVESLQESEARFRTMFERHSAPMLLIDPESGAIRDANAAAAEFYGYTDEEWEQLHIQDINDLPADEVAARRTDAEGGEQSQFVFPHRLKSGETRTVEVRSTPIEVHGTALLFSIIHDITAREEAREKLRQSEERWRRLVESNRDPIQITVDGTIRYINPAGARIFGAEAPEAVIGRPPTDFAAEPDVLEKLRALNRQLARGEPTEPMEYTIQRLDGEERTVVSYSQPIEYKGEPAAQTVIRDVTEQREAEEELRHLKDFYEQVLDAMPIDLAIFGPEGRYEYVTPSAIGDPERREHVIGMTDVEYAQERGYDPETARRRLSTIRRVARTREMEQFEETIEDHDGNPRHFIRFVTPVVQDGSVVNVLGYGLEITQRKQTEMKLRDAKEQVEASLAAKERFLATMSHEVRTPLNAVLGMAQLLARTDLTEDQRSYLQSIRFSGNTLLTLLDTVLDFAKLEAGEVDLEQVAFDPVRLAHHVRDMLRSKAKESNLDFRIEADPQLPTSVVGDAARVGQILTNLGSNALKFTDDGSVVICVEGDPVPAAPAEDSEAPTWITFRVEDTGIGIPPEQQDRIFGHFNQADTDTGKTRKGTREGTGLGLAIVQTLVDQMGGTIDLESTPGEGSVFTVRLPFATDGAESTWDGEAISSARPDLADTPSPDTPSPDTPSPETAVSASRPKDPPAGRLSGARLLVVEDNETNQVVVRDLLVGWGAEVDVVGDGVAALERLDAVAYDVVLMDVQMPRMDGLEATRRLRHDLGSDVPVIALTASMLRENRQEAFAAGMDSFVSKPFKSESLYRTVAEHLSDTKTASVPSSDTAPTPSSASRPAAETGALSTLDLTFLHENMGGAEAAWDVATTFRDQADAFVDDLAAARDTGDDGRLGDLFHSMKSAAQLVGAERLGQLAKTLDHTDPPYPPDRLDAIAEAARETRAALDESIEDLDGG